MANSGLCCGLTLTSSGMFGCWFCRWGCEMWQRYMVRAHVRLWEYCLIFGYSGCCKVGWNPLVEVLTAFRCTAFACSFSLKGQQSILTVLRWPAVPEVCLVSCCLLCRIWHWAFWYDIDHVAHFYVDKVITSALETGEWDSSWIFLFTAMLFLENGLWLLPCSVLQLMSWE